jgi:hypothetical protein
MRHYLPLWEILQEIDDTSPRLRLRFPANQDSLSRQLGRVQSASQTFEDLYDHVYHLSARRNLTDVQQAYGTLLDLLDEILHNASSYWILAEELAIDPEGTISCLKSIDRAIAESLKQVRHLRRFIAVHEKALLSEPRQNFWGELFQF